GPDEGQMAPPTRPEGEIPPLPNERSPFNMDSGNPANRPVNPAAPRGAGAGEPESGIPVTPRANATPGPRASSPTSRLGPGAEVSEAPANTSEDSALSSN